MKEINYNGIELAGMFPPDGMDKIENYERLPVPYLEKEQQQIDISVGRQLFVDDYLIEQTDFIREYHKPRRYAGNPIFYPETEIEKGLDGHVAAAAPFSDGVWYDGKEKKFKMWYQAGWAGSVGYAESMDGIHFQRICQKVEGIPSGDRDSCAVVFDRYHAEKANPYKLFLYTRNDRPHGHIYESCDGIHWKLIGHTGSVGDRTTIFYNPFRKKWVFSIRSNSGKNLVRVRKYCEADSLEEAAKIQGAVYWTRADRYDRTDQTIGNIPELYNLDAVAYESILLGVFTIFDGPKNKISNALGIPKVTYLQMSYSRDGFHWYRGEDRSPFLAPERENPHSWERGYLHSNNGICTVVGDELWFYYTGYQGDETKTGDDDLSNGAYARSSLGLAKLRRDGFASMNCYGFQGSLTTRTFTHRGEYLFVNADFHNGYLKAGILDENGKTIKGFGADDSICMRENSTCFLFRWNEKNSLKDLKTSRIKIRFEGADGALYAFWISDTLEGKSRGYLASGAVGYGGYQDV